MDLSLTRISAPFSLKPALLYNYSPSSVPLSSRIWRKILFNSNRKVEPCSSKRRAQGDVVFDESAFEAERLRLDEQARESMAETSKREMETAADDPKAWKWTIRKRIWDLMEARNFAQNPRPVQHRIPNFVGAAAAAKNVKVLFVCAYI